jgi:pimeloyl-ACP methyl ester carboxylesterase
LTGVWLARGGLRRVPRRVPRNMGWWPSWAWTFGLALALALALLSATVHAHDFLPCDDASDHPLLKGSLCARHVVPLDHGAKSEALSLFIRKFPARIAAGQSQQGEVWLLSGGPGESGAMLYPFIDRLRGSFAGFDLIVPDHRGTGLSTRLCIKEEAPESPGGSALVDSEWATCQQAMNADPARTRQFSVSQAARDLRSLLAARTAQPTTYLYAVSYGTQLALRALQMGPLPLRAVVLDSLVPLENDAQWDLSRRSIHVDDVGRQVLARCDANESCRKQLVESAALSLQRVLDRLEAGSLAPSLLDDVPGRDLKMFMGQLLDWPAARVHIPAIIKELEEGSDASIKPALAALQTATSLFQPPPQMPLSLPVSLPLSALISGSENNLRPELTVGAVRQSASRLLFTSPLPELLTQRELPMYARDKFFGKPMPASSQVPPLLVFSGTLDPKTHLEGARKHVAALRGSASVSWVQAEGAPHFVLWTAPACFDAQLQRFLQGVLPTQVSCAEAR